MKKKSILMIASFIGLAFVVHAKIPQLSHQVQNLGALAPIFFMLVFCLSGLLCLPTMPFVLAGGALFGPIFGTLLSLLSATTSAICAFLISRHLGTSWLSSCKNTSIQHLIKHIKSPSWKSVALLRLIPAPFSLVNYGFGLTQIKLRSYTLTTFLFLIPYKVMITYCGYAGSF